MYYSCHNPDEHKKEGEDDFQRHGSWGYDQQKYRNDHDDCDRAYTDGFNEAKCRDERRRQELAEEEAEERRMDEMQMEQRRQEEYEEQAYDDQRMIEDQY